MIYRMYADIRDASLYIGIIERQARAIYRALSTVYYRW